MKNPFVKYIVSVAAAGYLTSAALSNAQEADEDTGAEFKASVVVAQSDPTNWREVDPENLIVFETTKGRILIEAFPEIAPNHANQYRAIVRSGDYDGVPFHRVIDGFMAQGGNLFAHHGRESGLPDIPAEFTFRRDPAQLKFDMIGDPDHSLQGYYKGLPVRTESAWLAELVKDGKVQSNIPHCAGITSAARQDGNVNSANAQFFLMRDHTPGLDEQYSPWGRIVDGEDVPRKMKTGDPQVVDPDILTRARMADDLPEDKRPRVWVQRTDGPIFQAEISGADDTDVCDRPSVPTIVHN